MYKEYLPAGLLEAVSGMYAGAAAAGIRFHDWRHVDFVARVATQIALGEQCGTERVAAAALLHDMNYFVDRNSKPEAGEEIRARILGGVGVPAEEIAAVEATIVSAHTGYRGPA